ncbi:MAG: hypothetical protein R2831_02950 [Chitinophagaceae bacterium]
MYSGTRQYHPSCIKYDPVHNPFDTDSTFWVDPHNGDVHFGFKVPFRLLPCYFVAMNIARGPWIGSISVGWTCLFSTAPLLILLPFYIDSNSLVNCIKDSDYTLQPVLAVALVYTL